MKNDLLIMLCCIPVLLATNSCKKKRPPSPEVIARYQVNAEKFCKAIVGCIQEDIRIRLNKQPERRDMVLGRMNRELCRKNQFQLLGSLQADPRGPQIQDYNQKLYESYDKCTRQLEQAKDCKQIKLLYNTDPDCSKVRSSKIAGK